jgi:hypothetical protein
MLRSIDKLIEAFELSAEEDCLWFESLGGKNKASLLLNSILKNKHNLDEYDIIQLGEMCHIDIDPYSINTEEYIEEFVKELKKELKNESSNQEK